MKTAFACLTVFFLSALDSTGAWRVPVHLGAFVCLLGWLAWAYRRRGA